MDREVISALQDAQANLRARRMDAIASVVGRGLALIWQAEEAKQKAVDAASNIPRLKAEVDHLKHQIAYLTGEIAKAQDEAKAAAVPRNEAIAEARAEVREILRPFLKSGEHGIRMLAMVLKDDLDARWGKEKS